MSDFATRLRETREARGLTQPQLAKLIGKGQSLIGNLEAGSRESSTYIPEIAHALGVDAYWLKTGVRTIIAGDPKIDEVVELMRQTAAEGRAVVLDKAREVAREYPRQNGAQKKG